MTKKRTVLREERNREKIERKARFAEEKRGKIEARWKENFERVTEWRVFFDGATGPTNPGQSGYGAVLYHRGIEIDSRSVRIGHATCNQAEYAGLIAALEMALERTDNDLVVCGDSQLVIQQVFGHWRAKTEHLKPLQARGKELASRFESIYDSWIPRELNGRADELSKIGVPEFARYKPASETDARAMRRCIEVILENPGIIIGNKETAFVLKMDDLMSGRNASLSPLQWKWLQDIEARLQR